MKKILYMITLCIVTTMFSCQYNKQEEPSKGNNTIENPVIKAIMNRRSIRQYQDRPVSREMLQQLAQCGVNAPNAMNKQRWQIRIVDNAEYIDGITKVYTTINPQATQDPGFKNMFRNAPAVIFVATNGESMAEIDCGLLGQNIMLAAYSMGLGTCCLGGPVSFMNNNKQAAPYVQRLNLPDGYKILYAIAVGYPAEKPNAKPRDLTKIQFID